MKWAKAALDLKPIPSVIFLSVCKSKSVDPPSSNYISMLQWHMDHDFVVGVFTAVTFLGPICEGGRFLSLIPNS